MIGKLDGDGFASAATRRQSPIQHLDSSLGFSSQVESDEADTLRQACDNRHTCRQHLVMNEECATVDAVGSMLPL